MADIDISRPPTDPDYVRFDDSFGQRFIITVDTEEEFDWNAPIDRDQRGLASVPALRRFQTLCEEFGVTPIYLVDQPVAEAPSTLAALGDAIAAGRAEIGAHLHPWVSPPYAEELSQANSFPGNLPPAIEHEKFRGLCRSIEQRLASRPLIYRAGRYGIGPNSAAMLSGAGIAIDASVRPLFDYSEAGGPDFSRHPLRPYWLDRASGLMEVPLTTVFAGPLRGFGGHLHPLFRRIPRLAGAMARSGMLQRIPLTPEGISLAEALRGIDIALGAGLPLLVFSFHSPSLAPGHTPYVRSEHELDSFYNWWRQVLGYLARRNIPPSSVKDILSSVALARRGTAS